MAVISRNLYDQMQGQQMCCMLLVGAIIAYAIFGVG